MTDSTPAPIPVPNLSHCYRCGLDYPPGLKHPLEECNNRVHEFGTERRPKWPDNVETKSNFPTFIEASMPREDD